MQGLQQNDAIDNISDIVRNDGIDPIASRSVLPIVTSRQLAYPNTFLEPRQVWVENLDTVEEEKLGLIDLHPDIFGAKPRVDIIHENVMWQLKYRKISFATTKTRAEVRGGGKKPWPQKGLGRARHGSIRSPLWKGGGVIHGPRSPTSYFYMLGFGARLKGLTSTLSVKLAQDDLHVVDNLELPTKDPQYLESLAEERLWGPSVLFIDDSDIMPENISIATETLGHMNLMPVYGLNVYSMLKHTTLVLTLAAVERLEERLLFQLHRLDRQSVGKKFSLSSA
nr:EOG090X0EDZ [Triops cancriformis]